MRSPLIIETLRSYIAADVHDIPLLRCFIPFALGIWLSSCIVSDYSLLAIPSLLLTLVVIFFGYNSFDLRWGRLADILLFLSSFLFGLSYSNLRNSSPSVTDYGDSCLISGYIADNFRLTDNDSKLIISTDSLLTQHHCFYNINGFVDIPCSDSDLSVGQQVTIHAHIQRPYRSLFSGFDFSSYLNHKNIQFSAIADEYIVGANHSSLPTFTGSVRNSVRDRLISNGVDSCNVDFLMALLVGDRSRLDSELKDQFSDCGLIHLIAVSGLHVGIVYALVCIPFGGFRRRKKWFFSVPVIASVWLYAFICGLSPATMRAVIMMSVFELSLILHKQNLHLNTLCVSAFIILLVQPLHLFDLGFWFSFSAVWGIICFNPVVRKYNPIKNVYLSSITYDALCVSIIAQLATLPLSLLHFHKFSTYFLINNLLIANSVYYVVLVALLVLLTGHVLPSAVALNWMVDHVRLFTDFASSLPLSVVKSIPFSLSDCILLFAVLYSLNWFIRSNRFVRRKSIITTAALSSVLILSFCITLYETYNRHLLVVYETGHKLNVSEIDNCKAIHFVSDTLHSFSANAVRRFDEYYYADVSETKSLSGGLKFCGSFQSVVLARCQADLCCADSSSAVIISAPLSPCGSFAKVIVTSETSNYDAWFDYCIQRRIPCLDASQEAIYLDL